MKTKIQRNIYFFHHKLISRFSWYRNWHLYRYYSYVHFSILIFICCILSINLILFSFSLRSEASPAANFRLNTPLYHQEYRLSCEVTSLRMALATHKIYVTEKNLIKYLPFDRTPRSEDGKVWGNPHKGFVGDINGIMHETGYGVYWEPIAKLAKRYTSAYAFSGWSLSRLLSEVKKGNPVIVWGSSAKNPTYFWWRTPGNVPIYAVSWEHTRVVVGFVGSPNNPSSIILNDPAEDSPLYWSKSEFLANWNLLLRSGVVVQPPQPVKMTFLDITSSSFYQGDKVTVNLTLKNNKKYPIVLDLIGVAVRYGNKVRDFPSQTNIKINKYSSKTFIFKRSFNEIGSHKFWPYIVYKRNEYSLAPPKYFYVNPIINIISFSLTPVNPKVGEEITFSITLKNNSLETITLDSVGIIMKNYTNNTIETFSEEVNITINAGETFDYSQTKSFAEAGLYNWWLYFSLNGIKYYSPKNSFFTIRIGSE